MDVRELIRVADEAGLITDPFVTATILNYEAGFVVRSMFYASSTGDSPAEKIERAGHLAFAHTELADLLTQVRILAHINGWEMGALQTMGEERLKEAAKKYTDRGVRPWDALLRRLRGRPLSHAPPSPPFRDTRVYQREGD